LLDHRSSDPVDGNFPEGRNEHGSDQ
jgi:hypothetical protein